MIGLKLTVGEYIERLVSVFRGVRRVLREDGTLWLNIGDAYAGAETGSIKRTPGLKPKDMIGIPWMLAFALRADGWFLRSDIIWHKPNPMPSSVTDRPTSSHEHIFLLSKSKRYFYDADAIREPLAESSLRRLSQKLETQAGSDRANGGAKANGPMRAVFTGLRFGGNKGAGDSQGSGERLKNGQEWRPRTVDGKTPPGNRPSRHGNDIPRVTTRPGTPENPDANDGLDERWSWANRELVGANVRDVWTIATSGFKGAHFATFPEELARRCILAGTSERGACARCGAPWKRVTETQYDNPGNRSTNGPRSTENREFTPGFEQRLEKRTATLGWEPTCSCDAAAQPSLVLDPFLGSGTTAAVAIATGREYVGYEISENYRPLIQELLGMFYREQSI